MCTSLLAGDNRKQVGCPNPLPVLSPNARLTRKSGTSTSIGRIFVVGGVFILPSIQHYLDKVEELLGSLHLERVYSRVQGKHLANGCKCRRDISSCNLLSFAMVSLFDSCGKSGD